MEGVIFLLEFGVQATVAAITMYAIEPRVTLIVVLPLAGLIVVTNVAPDAQDDALATDGSILEPYADRFVEILGEASLVSRDVVRDADHMIQEYAPERVIQALRDLLASGS